MKIILFTNSASNSITKSDALYAKYPKRKFTHLVSGIKNPSSIIAGRDGEPEGAEKIKKRKSKTSKNIFFIIQFLIIRKPD